MPCTQPACSLHHPAVHSHMLGKHWILTHNNNSGDLRWPLHRFDTPSSTLKCLKFLSSVLFETSLLVYYSSAIDESLCWGHHLCYNKTSHHIWNATPTPASAYSCSPLLSLLVSCFKHKWIAEMYILNSAALTLFPKVFYLSIRSWKTTVLSKMIFL